MKSELCKSSQSSSQDHETQLSHLTTLEKSNKSFNRLFDMSNNTSDT